jgi:hypothetical protein
MAKRTQFLGIKIELFQGALGPQNLEKGEVGNLEPGSLRPASLTLALTHLVQAGAGPRDGKSPSF